jgi:hypothetical protein
MFVEGGAEFSFAWDAWSCQNDLSRQYLACYGHALTESFEMLRSCLFVVRIQGFKILMFVTVPLC